MIPMLDFNHLKFHQKNFDQGSMGQVVTVVMQNFVNGQINNPTLVFLWYWLTNRYKNSEGMLKFINTHTHTKILNNLTYCSI